jgi:lysophospholipase L1-like esterase
MPSSTERSKFSTALMPCLKESDMSVQLHTRTRFARPIILFDGDSKTMEAYYAAVWATARSRLNVHLGPAIAGGSIGGSTTGNNTNGGVNGMLVPARLNASKADVAARVAAGQLVDICVTIGTNDLGRDSVPAETVLANIRRYVQEMKASGARYIILMSVDPRASGGDLGAARIQAYNRGLQDLARIESGVRFCDTWPYLMNAALSQGLNGGGSNAAFSVSSDGLHFSGYGCYVKSFAIEPVLAEIYPKRTLISISADDYYDAAAAPRGNFLSLLNYQNGQTATGVGRTRAMGGTDNLTLAGTASKAGTPPIGWAADGALTGNMNVTFSVSTSPLLEAELKGSGYQCVKVNFSGTPAANGYLQLSRLADTGTNRLNQATEFAVLMELQALTGFFGFQLGQSYSSGNEGISTSSTAPNAVGLPEQLPSLTGLYEFHNILTPANYQYAGVTAQYGWRAGVPVSGSLIMIGAVVRPELSLPAPTA